MPVPCPGRDCCRAGARKCRTRSGNGADTGRIRGAGDSQQPARRVCSSCCRRTRERRAASDASLRTAYLDALAALERHEIAALALTLGVILFAVATAIALLRTRTRAAERLTARQAEINELREERDRANALLLAEPQVIVVWPAGADAPEISGDVSIIMRTPLPRRVLAFGTWLAPEDAQAMEVAVDALRAEGKAFALSFATLQQRHVAVEGRAIGGRAVLRIKDLTGARSELAALTADHQRVLRDIETVGRLLETLPAPVWARDAAGRLTWVNAAYARAVEARDGTDAVARNLEMLDSAARDGAESARGRPANSTRRGCRSSWRARAASCT